MPTRATYILLLLSFALISVTHQARSSSPAYLFLTRVGPCADGEATAIVSNEMTIYRKEYNFSISGRLNVTRDISEGWMVKATMQKCQDIRNLDTCDHFKSYTAVENACTDDEMSDDKELYQSVFDVSTPRLSCPIKAGVYKISDYPFVTKDNHLMVSESKISTSLFGYTFRLDGYSDDEKIMCIEAYLQLVYSTKLLRKDSGEKESAEDDQNNDSKANYDDSKAKNDKTNGGDSSKADDDDSGTGDAGKINGSNTDGDDTGSDGAIADDDKSNDDDSKTEDTKADDAEASEDHSKAEDAKASNEKTNNSNDDSKAKAGDDADENINGDEGDEGE